MISKKFKIIWERILKKLASVSPIAFNGIGLKESFRKNIVLVFPSALSAIDKLGPLGGWDTGIYWMISIWRETSFLLFSSIISFFLLQSTGTDIPNPSEMLTIQNRSWDTGIYWMISIWRETFFFFSSSFFVFSSSLFSSIISFSFFFFNLCEQISQPRSGMLTIQNRS